MDKNTIIGFVLIGVVLMIWLWMNSPPPSQRGSSQDSTAHALQRAEAERPPAARAEPLAPTPENLGKFFSPAGSTKEEETVIDCNLYRAVLSSRGGAIKSWELKKFKTWNGFKVDLINGE